MRVAAGTLATAVVAWLPGKKIEKIWQESLQRDLEKAKPSIEAAIKARKTEALEILSKDGKKAFAVIRFSITNQELHNGPGVGWAPTAPELKYLELRDITDTPIDKEDGEDHDYFNAPGSMLFVRYYLTSLELTFSADKTGLYHAYKNEIVWDRNKLISQLSQALAD